MKSLLNKRLRIIPSALALIVSLAWETAVVLGQTLPVVSSGTLLVHLEADAGVSTDVPGGTNITSWTDQSGNSFYFPADVSSTNRAYPTLTTNDLGIPLVHFAGTGLFGDSGSLSPSVELFPTSSSALTIFTVFRTAKSGSQEYLLDDAVNPISSAYDVTMELGVDAGARGTGNYGLHRGSGDATFTPNNTISNNVLYVMTTVIKPNGYPPDNVEIYKDGIAQSLGTAYGGGKPLYPGWLAGGQYAIGDQGLFIGGRVNALNSSVDANFSGDIGEILLYQGALSLHDRAAVEAYLASKYGVAVAPPPGLAITAQPQPLAVTNGESATFTVAADSANGDSIAYQWQKDGTNIDNATDASLTISSVSVTNVGAYQCVVSIPSTNVTSESVQLRLYTNTPLPAISSGTLLVHLEADAGVVTNGSDLTTWFDQSPNQFEFDVTTSPNLWLFAPTVTTGLTGNQVIHFGGAAQTESSVPIQLFTDTNSPLTVFAAFSVQDNSSQTYLFNSLLTHRVEG